MGIFALNCSFSPSNPYYVDGYPTGVINRDPQFTISPTAQYLDYVYTNYWEDAPGVAKIDLYVAPEAKGGKLKVETNTTFAINDDDAAYRLAFVIVEDGLTGVQKNYYSGEEGSLEWWDKQPEYVIWDYSHTARDIFDVFGIEGSVPEKVEKGKPVYYTTDLSLDNVEDITKTSIVALLMDGYTGVILNAAQVDYANYSAVENIIAGGDAEAPVEYFNLQGIKVMQPASGSVVIRRQGAEVSKILVK